MIFWLLLVLGFFVWLCGVDFCGVFDSSSVMAVGVLLVCLVECGFAVLGSPFAVVSRVDCYVGDPMFLGGCCYRLKNLCSW